MNPVLPMDVLLPLLALALGLAGFGAWRSTRGAPAMVRLPILACRGLALLALAGVALNPGHERRWLRNANSDWALLLDRSASMTTADTAAPSRWHTALQLAGQAMRAADDPGRARIFTFAGQLENEARDLAAAQALRADGATTDLSAPLRTLLERYEGAARSLAGVVLVSDGRQLAGDPDPALGLRARAMDAPVFALGVGGPVPRTDLAVSVPPRHLVTFAGQELRIPVQVANHNLGEIRTSLRLLDAAGKELAQQVLVITNNAQARAELVYRAGDPGYHQVRVKVDDWPGETTLADNTAEVGISVITGPISILLVEGAPHWDTKFLAQCLRQQPQFQVTTVHRVTGDRYFRIQTGAGEDAAETTQFPDSADALFQHDIVAFGKGAEYFLTPARSLLLQQFVRDHGGSVVFFRGKSGFGSAPDVEPLEPVEWGAAARQPLRWRPTLAGEQSGLFAGLLPGREDPVWRRLPPLQQNHTIQRLKSFAQVLAEGAPETAGSSVPVLVSRRAGNGLELLVNAEGWWQWDFFPAAPESRDFYNRFWVALFQWAAVQTDFLPGAQLGVRVHPGSVLPGEPVKAVVAGRAARGAAAAPILALYRDEQLMDTLTPRPTGESSNTWAAIFTPTMPGLYRIQAAEAAPGATDVVRQVTTTLEVRRPPQETDEVSADYERLAQLATESGGQLIQAADLDRVIRSLAPRMQEVEAGAAQWEPAWDQWLLVVLVAGLLAGEWSIRRRNGML